MKTLKEGYALLIAVGVLMSGLLNHVMAANYFWDTGAAAGYQSGAGTWDSSAFWTLNGTALATWPGDSTNNAYICTTTGTNVVTISSPVSVNQLGLGWTGSAKADNNWVTLTNGIITVGSGGIIVDGNKTAAIYSDIGLAANQTWDIRAVALPVYGNVTDTGSGYGITKSGTSTLSLYGTNSFSGDFVQSAGAVTAYSMSGLPLGSGSLTISNGLTLSITPAGSGSAVELSGGTNGNETISFNGKAKIYINTNLQSSVTYTFGNSADTGMAFVRNNRGLLSIIDTINTAGIGVKGQFKLANGATGVPIQNGMVDAYLTASDQTPFFMQYNEATGFQKYTYSYSWGSGIQASVNDNTRVYQIGNNGKPVLTNDCSIYALAMTGSSIILTLSNNAVLYLGNGVQPAGLILAGSTITPAANSTGSGLDFGASEGIVFNTYNASAAINVPIAGSGGVTFNINPVYGSLTLSEDNTYTGDTTIHGGNSLNIGTGGTRGSLASTNWIITGGGLNFNNSGTVNWAGILSGAGTVQNGGVGTLNLALSSGTRYGGTLANASSGTMNLTLAGTNTISALTSSGANGKMTFSGADSVNNMGNNFCSNSASSTNAFTSGTWSFTGGGNGANQVGTLFVNGATVKFSGGRYWHSAGGTTMVTNGTLQIAGDRWNPGEQQTAGTMIQVNVSGSGLLDLTYSQYGIGLGAGAVTGNGGTLVNQTGGAVQYGITPGTGTGGFLIGGNAHTNYLCAYNLSGGILRSKATITAGAWPSGSTNAFNWSGGTMAVNGITMANMASSDGVNSAISNTLFNSAGTLAPGDVGFAGKTTITGSYTESSANAALAIDIGGTTQATAFQTGQYDYLRVDVGTATLAGQLRVNLINSYVPLTTNRFTVLLCTNGLIGTFANVTDKILPLADGYSLFTNVTQNTTNVILSGYAVNEYLGVNWDSTSSWSQGVIPANQDYAAYFGTLASAFSPDAGTRTLKGLIFANPDSFTLSGTALTLQGDALTAPRISVTAGSHTISVPLALSNATEIAVATDSMLTLSGGTTGEQAVTKTGTGTLALSNVNTLGALTVSAGTVKQTAGTTTLDSLTFAGGTFDLLAGTLRITEGVAGGAIDTIAEVEAAITAGTIKGRGQTLQSSEFKISVVDGYVKVELKMRGTLISFQ